MSNTPIEFKWHSGQTLTADLVAADDTSVETGLSATELTNAKGRYRVTYTGVATGHHTLHVKQGGNLVAVYDYYLTDTTSVHFPATPLNQAATPASNLLEFRWFSGLTLTGDLIQADDTVVSSGLSATELTNGLGRYQVAFTGTPTGHHTLTVKEGTTVLAVFEYYLEEDIDVHYPNVTTTTVFNEATSIISPDAVSELPCSYPSLQKCLAWLLYGQRSITSPRTLDASELAVMDDCIRDGLCVVYGAYEWSFLRPTYYITTAEDDYDYDLPSGYDGLLSSFTFAADEGELYGPIKLISEIGIRKMRQASDYSDRPRVGAVTPKTYDATSGSQKQLLLYPTPDDEYVISAKMRLRWLMIDSTNLYPIGGEILTQVIIESVLAAAERQVFDNPMGVHQTQFDRLLPSAVQQDRESTSPLCLGHDKGGEEFAYGQVIRHVGTPTFDLFGESGDDY